MSGEEIRRARCSSQAMLQRLSVSARARLGSNHLNCQWPELQFDVYSSSHDDLGGPTNARPSMTADVARRRIGPQSLKAGNVFGVSGTELLFSKPM